jgi:HlyD family secretion protein
LSKRRRRLGYGLFLVCAAVAALGTAVFLTRGKTAARAANVFVDSVPRVEIVHPSKGGMRRTTVQPGSVIGFESVDLYAMVSGYLKTQSVDIGSRIHKGDVLAVIDAPREAKALEEASALVDASKAQIVQADARIKTMQGEREAADATVREAESDVDRLVSSFDLARKQLERVKGLVADRAADTRLLDENVRQFETAAVAERTARLAVIKAKAQLTTAIAKVESARADLAEAKAAMSVAVARLATAQVNVEYTKIIAPFNGVVTDRAFHPGAFIRSASEGGQTSLLTVKRTDLMRVIVQIPDRDVAITSAGDTAEFTVDALGSLMFVGTVSRMAESEDPTTRTMRVEIDLPNPKGLLREGMYGTATIVLEPVSANLTVPPACVMEHSGQTHGVVYLVRDGLAHRTQVELGADNGSLVEILSGVNTSDSVVLHAGVPLEDGLAVAAEPVQALPSATTTSTH